MPYKKLLGIVDMGICPLKGLLNGQLDSPYSNFKLPFTFKEMEIFFSIYTFICALN
jgi:hypothetical protein